jgi:hypothetical protein
MEIPMDEPVPSYFINWSAVESILDQARANPTTITIPSLDSLPTDLTAVPSPKPSGIRTIFLFQHDGSLVSYSGHRHRSKLVPSLCSHIIARIATFPPLISIGITPSIGDNADMMSNSTDNIRTNDDNIDNRNNTNSNTDVQQSNSNMNISSSLIESSSPVPLSSSIIMPTSIPTDISSATTSSSLLEPPVLQSMIIKCEQGSLCVANITHFLLCVEGDETVGLGMLKKRTDEVVQALKPLLNVYGTVEESN